MFTLYSRISKEGNLKDRIECAPNGYFFLPIYDKGEYTLQVFIISILITETYISLRLFFFLYF